MNRTIPPKERKRSPFLFGLTFRLLLIVAGAAMVISYLAVYINPSRFGLPLFFGLYYIPILLFNLLLLLTALIRRSRSAWIPLIALLPSLLYAELFVKIGGDETPEREGIKLKIESYNVGMFSSSRDGLSRDECRQAVLEQIRQNDPDIACFQEFYVRSREQIDTLLLGEYPYRHYHLFRLGNGAYFGNLILSRLPIGSGGKISFPRSTNLSVYADILHFGRTIRIYNNHLESYNVSFAALVQKLGRRENRNGEEIGHEIREVHEKMLGTFIRRSDQVNRILSDIRSSDYPAVICGDFNDTPMSYTYHRLSRGRKDSFRESGRGFGSTFSHLWPLLRIDYILFPEEFESIGHTTLRIPLSDHYPISTELII